jgi:cytochrome c oxidase subunit 2
MPVALQLVSAAMLTCCDGSLSALAPSGPAAASIAALWWTMLAGSVVLFALVMVLFALVVWRPGWGANISPVRWIVLGGLVLPALVLVPLVTYGMIVGERLLPFPERTPQRVEVEARQWVWTFHYPDNGGVTTVSTLHLPAGIPVDIAVSSRDVIHSFWIPRFAGKIDAVPGHINHLRIQADEPGRYEALCSEFCGLGHTGMRFVVVVHPANDFAAALARAAASGAAQ